MSLLRLPSSAQHCGQAPSSLCLEGPGAREEERSRKLDSILYMEALWQSPKPTHPGLLAREGHLGMEEPSSQGVSISFSKNQEDRLTENRVLPPLFQGLLSLFEDNTREEAEREAKREGGKGAQDKVRFMPGE